jgi:hypothetical protein
MSYGRASVRPMSRIEGMMSLEIPGDTRSWRTPARYASVLPARYNSQSELREEVKSDEENRFDFELSSEEKLNGRAPSGSP